MRAVIQRVHKAHVEVAGEVVGRIARGLVVFLGIGADDGEQDCRYIAAKIAGLRIFEDGEGLMNKSLPEAEGEILCVSQFTLYGDCRKGRRPSFIAAAPPRQAEPLYERVCSMLREEGLTVATGVFQAMMHVIVHNDGPVTILLDSRKTF
ncbi:MAG: D-aminoacyl-tRNA deacylase [Bacillota bacterium]